MEEQSQLVGKINTPVTLRRDPKFEPNIWGDIFLHSTPIDQHTKSQLEQEVKQLKGEVQKKLSAETYNDPKERLILIDNIEHLGVGYHFEEEIEANLQNFHKHLVNDLYEDDLHCVSLRFRLLRQHGFKASCDVFERFKFKNGNFNDDLLNDVEGILNLYEASYLRLDGENILDDAQAFTSGHLMSWAKEGKDNLSTKKITDALNIPLHRRTTRLESRNFMSIYELSHDDTLLKLAKQDFNLLQLLHKEELRDICRWSKSLDFTSKLPYVRDREAEAYFWILGIYYEPRYSLARIMNNKMFKIINILDDTYDIYGTIEELRLFTEAIKRWDKSRIDQLPDYMKFIYEIVLDTIQDLKQELSKEGRSYACDYMKKEIINTCVAYLQEAEWSHLKHVPTYDEYMKNGTTSAGMFYFTTATYLGMGAFATKDVFEWIIDHNSEPLVSINDLAYYKFEKSYGEVASAVECYMTEYGTTLETTHMELYKKVEEAWKNINHSLIRPTALPMSLIIRMLNLCRTLYDIYQVDEDAYTLAHPLRPKIEAILINPAI